MELDFDTIHRPEKYDEAAEEMSRLPQSATCKIPETANVDDNNLLYYIAGQESQPNTVPDKYEDEVKSLLANMKLMEARANDELC